MSSNIRIFLASAIVSVIVLLAVVLGRGLPALIVTCILIIIEVTFSFDNAIVNAKILKGMSNLWQQMFLTVGVVIAVFGMRIVFPIFIVMASAGLGWSAVIDLALHDHEAYARALLGAHEAIASFGGMFLLMLGLHFLFNKNRQIHWLKPVEERMARLSRSWIPLALCAAVLAFVTLLAGGKQLAILLAGGAGIVGYGLIHGFSTIFEKRFESKSARKVAKTGTAAFVAFLYLQVLDASFSLDGVIGAFAISKDVILIAVGLGIGALWVRSLTIYIVHRKTLDTYKYLEHGAYYTITVLALMLLISLFVEVPQFVTGGVSVAIIVTAVVSSLRANKLSAS